MNQTYFKQTIIIHLSKIFYADFCEILNFLLVLLSQLCLLFRSLLCF